jgi:HEAT repeat protein
MINRVSVLTIALTFLTTTSLMADNKLSERLVSLNTKIDFDEAYNKALEEMQELPAGEKEKLSLELSSILLNDKNNERRANAASALGDMCAEVKKNVEHLSKATKDKEKIVRQAMVSGVKRCGKSPEVIAALKSLSKDPDGTVKAQVEMALEQLK